MDGCDAALDGSDSFATRAAVNAACVAAGVPLISGALSQWEGQVSLFDPARGGPCYACVFPETPAAGLAPSCAEAGVVGALPGVIGSMMALEAVKLTSIASVVALPELLYAARQVQSVTYNATPVIAAGIIYLLLLWPLVRLLSRYERQAVQIH